MKQWKCAVCGQVFEGEQPPVPCPVCGAGESAFSEMEALAEKWRCTVCWQSFDGAKPPVPCPVCGAGESAFVKDAVTEAVFKNDTDDRFVLIGGGVASLEAAKAIRARNSTASIKMICGEGVIPYNRPALSDVVGDGLSFEAIALQSYEWYAENRIELICDAKCEKIIPSEKCVVLTGGEKLYYTKLLIATGSNAFMPVPETDKSIETAALRVFADADLLYEKMRSKTVIVVGGGILGVEAALALRERGCKISLVELAPRIMSLQADDYMSEKLKAALIKHGIDVYTADSLACIKNNHAILNSGKSIEAQLVLFCIGVRAETTLAREAGLLTDRGIIINNSMQTSNESIFAAGDCAQLNGRVFGLYSAAAAGGAAAGAAMSGEETSFTPSQPATAFEGAGINMFSCGTLEGPRLTQLTLLNDAAGIYKKLLYSGKTLVGAVLSSDVSEAADIINAVNSKRGYTVKI